MTDSETIPFADDDPTEPSAPRGPVNPRAAAIEPPRSRKARRWGGAFASVIFAVG